MEKDGNQDDLVRSLLKRHPGESEVPKVIPTKVANHLKRDAGFHREPWIPGST
jgi:hypothetical protein